MTDDEQDWLQENLTTIYVPVDRGFWQTADSQTAKRAAKILSNLIYRRWPNITVRMANLPWSKKPSGPLVKAVEEWIVNNMPDVLKEAQSPIRLAEEEDEEHLVCIFCGNEQIDIDRRVCGRCNDYKGIANVKICSLCGEDIYPTDEYCLCQDKPKEVKKEESHEKTDPAGGPGHARPPVQD